MYIAQQLKEKNIAEYLLYMWQVEDILRAHHLDPDELKQNYLAQFRATEETEKEMEEWYGHLIRMMKEEGIQEGGHLQINRNIILWLTDLHNQLLQSSKFPFYTAAYYKALPYIVELRNKGDKKDVSELENCFDALYGVMLLRLQHKPISDETAKAVSSQELATTAELAQAIGDYDSVEIVNELKLILNETKDMTDAELRAKIKEIAAKYDVTLTDDQMTQLVNLCRSLEKLDTDALLSKVHAVQDTLKQLAGAKDKIASFTGKVKDVITAIGDFFDRVIALFRK